MRIHALLAVSLLFALTSFAEQAAKRPWEWTVEERIAARTDPAAARERVRAHERLRAKTSGAVTEAERKPAVDRFDGKTHPELFLPHQVFDELIKLAFVGNQRMGSLVREDLMRDVVSHGLPPDFWLQLESISAPYVASYRALAELGGQSRSGDDVVALRKRDACRARAEALAAARNQFGRERFDRFLYESVAVNMFSLADALPDAALLRQAERGCP